MINSYKKYVNEKLSDKLSGFDENSLKQQFFDGKINYKKYINLCKQYNLNLPTTEENIEYVKKQSDNPTDMLIFSIENNIIDGVKYAIQNKADIHFNEDKPLVKAIQINNLEIVKYLVEHGADVHAREDEILVRYAHVNRNFEIVKYLLENDSDIHTWNENLLQDAILYDQFEHVKYYLEHGAIVYDNFLKMITSKEIHELLQKYYDKQNEEL